MLAETTKKTYLGILAKKPEPGRVKTRLTPYVSVEGSCILAEAFLQDTWQQITALPWAKALLATPQDLGDFKKSFSGGILFLQDQGDLGNKIEKLAQKALSCLDADGVMIIGGDTPGLPEKILLRAQQELQKNDAVIGPTEDGGFYLLGLRCCPNELLKGIAWSQESTFKETHARLRGVFKKVKVLKRWFDVDRPKDLARLQKLIEQKQIVAPATQQALGLLGRELKIAVIIPTLNEEQRIEASVQRVLNDPGFDEVYISDGGSTDQTIESLAHFKSVKLVHSAKGRAKQMNLGAMQSQADVLLFLHADVELPEKASHMIRSAMAQWQNVAGCFRTWTVSDKKKTWLSPLLHLADLRSRYTTYPYGDQALFVRRSVFGALGGFPEQELMEDWELSRRLKRVGKIKTLAARVKVSGRRMLARPLYYLLAINLFPLLYRVGVSPKWLAKLYGNPR